MLISKFIAKFISCNHILGMTLIGITPVLTYLLDLQKKNNKKHKFKIYLSLGLLNSGILLSYYINNNICVISIVENYFDSDKYNIYQVSKNIKFNLYISTVSLGLQYYFDNIKYKTISVGTYYIFLIGNLLFY